jgi:hypothetical protein
MIPEFFFGSLTCDSSSNLGSQPVPLSSHKNRNVVVALRESIFRQGQGDFHSED